MDLLLTTPRLPGTDAFFASAGFTRFAGPHGPIVTDGSIAVELGDARARPGFALLGEDWSDRLSAVRELGAVVESGDEWVAAAPSGARVRFALAANYALDAVEGAERSVLGNCAGPTVEVVDVAAAIAFWEAAGFVVEGERTNPWVVLRSPGGDSLTLLGAGMCPHTFANPSVSYFNGEGNGAVIAEVHARGLPIYEPVFAFDPEGATEPSNVILREPGGIGFFLFADG